MRKIIVLAAAAAIGFIMRRPREDDPKVEEFSEPLRPLGSRFIWKITDAIVVTMLRMPRPEGGWTAAALAREISDCDEFAFECSLGSQRGHGYIQPEQVNAAISGISTRARRFHYVTDVIEPWLDVSTGLKTPWRNRRWHLTPEGSAHARTMIRARAQGARMVDQRRARASL